MVRTKGQRPKSLCIPAVISGFFGVNEPAIYGITLPRKKHLSLAVSLEPSQMGLLNISSQLDIWLVVWESLLCQVILILQGLTEDFMESLYRWW